MNKKANIFFGVILFFLCFVMGVLIIPFFTDNIDIVRTNLDCSSPLVITDGIKLTCLSIDLLIPYFIWFFVSLGVGILAGVGK